MSKKLIVLGIVTLVVVFAMMFVAQLAVASVDDSSVASVGTGPQTGSSTGTSAPGQPIVLCGGSQPYNTNEGTISVWDRNGDGVMDAWDVNNDGIVDRWDPNVSCAGVTTSRLPITGAPALALIAVATAMLGAGLVLRRSQS